MKFIPGQDTVVFGKHVTVVAGVVVVESGLLVHERENREKAERRQRDN